MSDEPTPRGLHHVTPRYATSNVPSSASGNSYMDIEELALGLFSERAMEGGFLAPAAFDEVLRELLEAVQVVSGKELDKAVADQRRTDDARFDDLVGAYNASVDKLIAHVSVTASRASISLDAAGFSDDGPLREWLETIGMGVECRTYEKLLRKTGIDPRRAPTTDDALVAAGIGNRVHRRKIVLASVASGPGPGDTKVKSQTPRTRRRVHYGSHPGPMVGENKALPASAYGSSGARLEQPLSALASQIQVISAWNSNLSDATHAEMHRRPAFHALARPIMATLRNVWHEGEGGIFGHSSFHLSGYQFIPRISRLAASGHKSSYQLPRDEALGVKKAGVVPKPGSHAFVSVYGEKAFRIGHVVSEFGMASGHALLAAEGRVAFAGEILVGDAGEVLAWSNMSGTYRTPRDLAAQVALPVSMLWVVVDGDDGRGTAERDLEARFGHGRYLRLRNGVVLAHNSSLHD